MLRKKIKHTKIESRRNKIFEYSYKSEKNVVSNKKVFPPRKHQGQRFL